MADAEVVRRMLAAATTIVESRGITLSVEHLVFDDVIRMAGVSRTAAFRIWPSKERFSAELVEAMAEQAWQGRTPQEDLLRRFGADYVASCQPHTLTGDERWNAFLELLRIAPRDTYELMRSSAASRAGAVLLAMLTTMEPGPDRDRLLALSRAADQAYLRTMSAFYEATMAGLGLRLRPEYQGDMRPLVWLNEACTDGLSLRDNVRHGYRDAVVHSPPFAPNDEPWSIPSLGIAIVATQMVEVIDPWP